MKLCIDCKWHQPRETSGDGEYDLCANLAIEDNIAKEREYRARLAIRGLEPTLKARYAYCEIQRKYDIPRNCAMEARFFEPKEPPVPTSSAISTDALKEVVAS